MDHVQTHPFLWIHQLAVTVKDMWEKACATMFILIFDL